MIVKGRWFYPGQGTKGSPGSNVWAFGRRRNQEIREKVKSIRKL